MPLGKIVSSTSGGNGCGGYFRFYFIWYRCTICISITIFLGSTLIHFLLLLLLLHLFIKINTAILESHSLHTGGDGGGSSSSCNSFDNELLTTLWFPWSIESVRDSVSSPHSWCCWCGVTAADNEVHSSLRTGVGRFPFASNNVIMVILTLCNASCGGIDASLPASSICFCTSERVTNLWLAPLFVRQGMVEVLG